MHVPSHMENPTTEALAGLAALAAVGYAVSGARAELTSTDRAGSAPTSMALRAGQAAAVAGFVFAAQLVNFPVAAGTSGHLIGAVLAAILLGPRLGLLTMAAVLVVQAVVFADGGLSALGLNLLLMGVVPIAVLLAVRGAWRGASVIGLAAVASALSVPVGAVAFAGIHVVGATAGQVDAGRLAAAMLGTHALIGVGEGIITAAVVAAVLALAPNLVHAYRAGVGGERAVSISPAWAVTGLGLAAVVSAAGLSRFASPHPDGLEFVSTSLGLQPLGAAEWVPLLAGYGQAAGIDVGLAGGVGLAACAAAMWIAAKAVALRAELS